MTQHQFAGMLYRNTREMHVAIAEEWLSAGGRNTREDILHDLAVMSDADLADEAVANWDKPDEHFDRDELIAAFCSIRANFDTHFPAHDCTEIDTVEPIEEEEK